MVNHRPPEEERKTESTSLFCTAPRVTSSTFEANPIEPQHTFGRREPKVSFGGLFEVEHRPKVIPAGVMIAGSLGGRQVPVAARQAPEITPKN